MFEIGKSENVLNKDISKIFKTEIEDLKKGILDEKTLKLYYDILKFTHDLSKKIIKVIDEANI